MTATQLVDSGAARHKRLRSARGQHRCCSELVQYYFLANFVCEAICTALLHHAPIMRSYQLKHTRTHRHPEVKSVWAGPVLRMGTPREAPVMHGFGARRRASRLRGAACGPRRVTAAKRELQARRKMHSCLELDHSNRIPQTQNRLQTNRTSHIVPPAVCALSARPCAARPAVLLFAPSLHALRVWRHEQSFLPSVGTPGHLSNRLGRVRLPRSHSGRAPKAHALSGVPRARLVARAIPC